MTKIVRRVALRGVVLAGVGVVLFLLTPTVQAAPAAYAALPVVKPVLACEALAAVPVQAAVGAPVTIAAAVSDTTPQGRYCRVTGVIAPSIHFEVDLPAEHWTQRYLGVGCGGLCGSVPNKPDYVANCVPALNGEFAVAFNDLGHESRPGARQIPPPSWPIPSSASTSPIAPTTLRRCSPSA